MFYIRRNNTSETCIYTVPWFGSGSFQNLDRNTSLCNRPVLGNFYRKLVREFPQKKWERIAWKNMIFRKKPKLFVKPFELAKILTVFPTRKNFRETISFATFWTDKIFTLQKFCVKSLEKVKFWSEFFNNLKNFRETISLIRF